MKQGQSRPALIQPYSFGYAAKNISSDSDELEVVPMEKNLFLSGELNSEKETLSHKGVDSFGNPYEVEVNVSMSLNAKWMKFGSLLDKPPFIRRGERVMIYRIADSDRYYWESLGLDDRLRRKDTWTLLLSNYDGDGDIDALTPENAYVIQASTHQGLITIQTNQSSGERWAYTVQLNTKEGFFVIEDSDNNQFLLDSGEKLVSLKNTSGSFVSIKDRSIKAFAADSIDFRTKTLTMSLDELNVDSKTVLYNTGSFVVKAANVAITASTALIKATTNFIGRLRNNGIKVGSDHRHLETGRVTKTPF